MMIKQNKAGLVMRLATLVLGLGLAGFGIASLVNQVSAASDATVVWEKYPFKAEMRKVTSGAWSEYKYKYDAFEADYSKGVAYIKPKSVVTHGGISCKKNAKQEKIQNGNYFCGNNTTKKDTIYVEFGKAAYSLDYGWLDIKEYDWVPNGAIYALNLTNGGMASDEGSKAKNTNTNIHREIHFYKAGTSDEVTFKGIIAFADFDWGEGYSITRGLHRGYVITTSEGKTPLIHYDENTWYMSGNGSTTGLEKDLKAKYNGQYVLWAEVEGSQAKPLKLVFKMPVLRRGSKNNTPYSYVRYQMNGATPANVKYRQNDLIATYGKLSVNNPPSFSDTTNFRFNEWKLSNGQSPNGVTVDENGITLYGNFTKNTTEPATRSTSITTSITNGSISPSADNVSADDDYNVGFFCNNGYTIGSVLVNNVEQEGITGISGDYTFGFASMSEVAEQYNITVSCVVGSEDDQDDDEDDDTIGMPSVITSIENGTITEDITNVDADETYDVEYSCNEGLHLASILVDGEEVNISDHPTSYTFENVSSERTIAVVCTDAKAPNTGSIVSGSFGEDGTAGGNLNIAAIIASSLVSVTGIALIYRFVRRSNAYSFKK